MTSKKNHKLSLDKFISFALYNKKFGYYMKKNPFGTEGDYITAPNISRLFSEMIAIWIFTFWQSLGCPKKFNLIELGAGNGEMMKILIESFKNFPKFLKSCNFIIHEKSPSLIKIQKKKLSNSKIIWLSKINKLKKNPCIFIANEFFDSLPIKQFLKKENLWFEKCVNLENKKKTFFIKKFDMKKFEKKINYKISKNENFVEYSELGIDYLKDIAKIIKKNSGGMLLIDYGYYDEKMKNTLQAISKHKFSNILKNIGNTDITHNINFTLFKKIIKQLGDLENNITTQKKFLINIGIKQRAEIISKNLNFLKKADIYYRLKRLIDEKQMGNLFKVMLIKNKKNKFKLGFKN
jgi:cyclopropane-fatty-acyl-phospholipid synthase